jgi:hypothetical protein
MYTDEDKCEQITARRNRSQNQGIRQDMKVETIQEYPEDGDSMAIQIVGILPHH